MLLGYEILSCEHVYYSFLQESYLFQSKWGRQTEILLYMQNNRFNHA